MNLKVDPDTQLAAELADQAHTLLRVAAWLDPNRCPPECSEAHTLEFPCALSAAAREDAAAASEVHLGRPVPADPKAAPSAVHSRWAPR